MEACNQHEGTYGMLLVMLFRHSAASPVDDWFAFNLCFKSVLGMKEEEKM